MKVRVKSISPMGVFRCAGKAWSSSEVVEEVSVDDALRLMACPMLKVEEVSEPAPAVSTVDALVAMVGDPVDPMTMVADKPARKSKGK